MRLTEALIARLRCRVVDALAPNTSPSLLVVLCHGYGAPGDDLVPLAEELCATAPDLREAVRFVFPEAPLEIPFAYGGRAWWNIDIQRWTRAFRDNALDAEFDGVPPGAGEARKLLLGLVDELARVNQLGRNRIVLGGFSQGAMIAADAALRLEEAPAGLVLFSGAPIGRGEWRTRNLRRAGLPVVQCHGVDDDVVPFIAGESLRDALLAAGADVRFSTFRGGHTIPRDGLEQLRALLRASLQQ